MRIWLTRKKPETIPSDGKPSATEGWLHPESAQTLLAETTRQQLIQFICQSTTLPTSLFECFWLTPLQRFAELAQLFPASENHHHAYAGGLLDHSLEAACYAARLRQSYLFHLMQRRKIRPRSPNAGQRSSFTPRSCTIWANSSPILKSKILAGNAGFHGMVR